MNKQQLEQLLDKGRAYRELLKHKNRNLTAAIRALLNSKLIDKGKPGLRLVLEIILKENGIDDEPRTIGHFKAGPNVIPLSSLRTTKTGMIPDSVGGFGSSKTGGGIVRKLTAKEKVQQRKLARV